MTHLLVNNGVSVTVTSANHELLDRVQQYQLVFLCFIWE